MRQATQTENDAKLRTALTNMRYAACTADDIAFLRTRVASDREGHPKLDSKLYRDVSVITAWNIQKDCINEYGAERFAQDTGQDLVDFYSVDKLSARSVDKYKWRNCEQAHFRTLGPRLQQKLWSAPPTMNTEQIPGKLRLCVGMPVMIKANEATELCITKGQEGKVVGWVSALGPSDQQILDTLFVELVDPPRPVQILDLPPNVVPLSRTPTHITALLQDDSLLSLNREQVMVLGNFAMTDYASQGKSRAKNVVHLNNMKDHRAYYVALSRGTTAEHTVIMQGFDTSKITGGMNGYLRQELRELEILDEITKLRHENALPREVCGIYRGQLITSYRKWLGGVIDDPDHFHPSIRNAGRDDDANFTRYSAWVPTIRKTRAQKRKAEDDTENGPAKKTKTTQPLENINAQTTHVVTRLGNNHGPARGSQGSQQPPAPVGLIWDSTNWSCGYDALLTPLACLLKDDPIKWSARLGNMSALLGVWAAKMAETPTYPENARDAVRTLLRFSDAMSFPLGQRGIMLDSLFMAVTNRETYGNASTFCENCNYRAPGTTSTLSQSLEASWGRTLEAESPQGMTVGRWLQRHFDRPSIRCPHCQPQRRMRRLTRLTGIPDILILSFNGEGGKLLMEEELCFARTEGNVRLRLRGLLYHSRAGQHFTSVVVDKNGTMWYHDGITTGRRCVNRGNFRDANPASLMVVQGATLSAALYAKDD
ncbi:hypothetical protein C8R43DRAFT_874748 [Mycena crocata]|nr:hypothetical protein C8R43DRAFT_874748 [Mycena crocata]